MAAADLEHDREDAPARRDESVLHRAAGSVLSLAWPNHPRRWADVPGAVRPTLTTVARLTVAAVIAFGLTVALSNGEVDLTGPLTALLVLQASALSTLKMGLVRVGAVFGGVLIAIGLSTWIGLTWWSLGLAIAAALLAGKVLRLGDQALETPISAMLILAVSFQAGVAAETRVLNTLIGAFVGMAFGLLFPTAMQAPAARRSVIKVAESTARPLTEAAATMIDTAPVRAEIEEWLNASRDAVAEVSSADQRLAALRDSRRFNPRALGVRDTEPVLSSAVQALERCLLAVRAMFVAMLAGLPDPEAERPSEGTDHPGTEDPAAEELRRAFGALLGDVAECLRCYGELASAEAEGEAESIERAAGASVEVLRETRAFLIELQLTDVTGNPSAWLVGAPLVAAVGQVLNELDIEERRRARQRRSAEEARLARRLPPLLEGVLPHPERPYPRAVDTAIAQLRTQRRQPVEPYASYLEPDRPPEPGPSPLQDPLPDPDLATGEQKDAAERR